MQLEDGIRADSEAAQEARPAKPKRGRIAASLAAATCSLLAAAPGPSLAQEVQKSPFDKLRAGWTFDTGLLYYGESDRVTDASLNILGRRTFADGQVFSFKFGVDTLTGSSASGATPAGTAQTFTQPSGSRSYTIAPGQTPLDPSFLDTRFALTANWERPLGERWGMDVGASFSTEYDYLHAGVNSRFYRDFNGRNTRLNFGLAFASDSIDPVGGAPVPLSSMLPANSPATNKLGSDSKTVTDLLVGVTQVFGRRTLAQFNYSYSNASGYQTDPYKIISVIDPLTGLPAPGPGSLNLHLFESRPDSRVKHSLYGQVKRHLKRDIVDVGYRLMTDDWGVTSHTVDARYRFNAGKNWYLQPHIRYYMQSETDFWVPYLPQGSPLPQHASADYRLGEFDAITAGAKYARVMQYGREWSVRAEYYNQSGSSPPEAAVGSLANLDLYPSVDAIIVQFGYKF